MFVRRPFRASVKSRVTESDRSGYWPSLRGRLSARTRRACRQPLCRAWFEQLEARWLLASAADLLYLAIDNASISSTNAGLLLVADAQSGAVGPLHAQVPYSPQGYSGLTSAGGGQLWATANVGLGLGSQLVQIDPLRGLPLSHAAIRLGSQAIGIGDLAWQPDSGRLFGIGSGQQAGILYTIEMASGAATFVGSTNLNADGGLAFAPDGTLYFASAGASGEARLYTLEPATAQVITSVRLGAAPPGSPPLASVQGLGVAQDGRLIGSDSKSGILVRIDPSTGARTPLPLDAPDRGVIGDVAFPLAAHQRALTEVYHEDFENGPGGFVADNTGRTQPGYWHYSLGRRSDGLINHTPTHSWYYGGYETARGRGSYDSRLDHQGTITSPLIAIPSSGVSIVSFSYVLDTRPELDVDFVTVSVVSGSSRTEILSRQDGSLPQTGRSRWLTATADLTAFAGQQVQLVFSFDTGPAPLIDPEGWYVDDLVIVNIAQPTPDIAGYKWDDRDADGTWDAEEPGLNGWTIYLDLNENGQRESDEPAVVTAHDGEHDGAFQFDGLPAGSYVVREELPTPWLQTFPAGGLAAPRAHTVAIDPAAGLRAIAAFGQTASPSFGNAQPDIAGYKWDDLDGDGVWDTNEPGLNGWTIYLDLDNDNVLDAGEPSFVTRHDGQHDGAYWFFGLSAGTYIVREQFAAGVQQTYPAALASPTFEHAVSIDPSAGVRALSNFGQAVAPNFGNVPADIAGYKWDDVDGDGLWDTNEPGLNGWTIYLDLDNDNVLDAGEPTFVTRNDGQHNGAYWFFGLSAGTYVVREQFASGVQQTYPAASVSPTFEHTVSIDPSAGVRALGNFGQAVAPNFGNVPADIAGYKWDDQDGDGVWDPNEPGLNGWTIYLDLDDDNVLDADEPSFVTRNDGQHDGAYWFFGLSAGTYIVREQFAAGVQQTYPATLASPTFEHAVSIDPSAGVRALGTFGQAVAPNFGNVPVDIAGYKWDDLDGDGAWDPNEPGLNGWTIYLDLDNDNVLDAGEPTFVTRNDGQHDGAYWFFGLSAGTYIVREQFAAGVQQTYPAASVSPTFEHTVSIDPSAGVRALGTFGQSVAPNFGNVPVDIVGYKWVDQDGDGVWDAGEPGLNGWTVYLDLDNDNVLDSGEPSFVTRSNGQHDGAYWFSGLTAGTYVVREQFIGGVQQTYPAASTTPTFEHAVSIDLSAGVHVIGAFGQALAPNFGNVPVDIAGYKWDDQDGDGVWDANEPGLNGWTIYLDLDNDNVLDSGEPSFVTRNNGQHDGAYWFVGVSAGTYVVREEFADAWKQTYPAVLATAEYEHEVTINPAENVRVRGAFGQAASPNFGNGLPDISGYKWDDLDQDGQWDASEPGLNGWTIYLDLNNNDQLDASEPSFVTRSDGQHDGAYWFFGLAAGTYTVREELQADWQQTYPADSTSPIFEHQVTIDPAAGRVVSGVFGEAIRPNFGAAQIGVAILRGVKYFDTDQDGTRDPGEGALDQSAVPVVGNWEIRAYLDVNQNGLLDAGDLLQDQIQTAAEGDFQLSLPPGHYLIVELLGARGTQQPPWQQTGPLSAIVNLDDFPDLGELGYALIVEAGQIYENLDFGNFREQQASILSGSTFYDRNADGDRDLAEEGLAAWQLRVFADTNLNGVLDPVEILADAALQSWQRITTSVNGSFNVQLPDEVSGRYLIVEQLQPGWIQIPLSQSSPPQVLVNPSNSAFGPYGYVLDVSPGSVIFGLNFGNWLMIGSKRIYLASTPPAPVAAAAAAAAAPSPAAAPLSALPANQSSATVARSVQAADGEPRAIEQSRVPRDLQLSNAIGSTVNRAEAVVRMTRKPRASEQTALLHDLVLEHEESFDS